MAVINTGMRKVIKVMAVTCQTAQFVSLMPKPKDFVTRIVGDVVLLSSKVQTLSDDINKLLDDYSDIPINYLMTQVNTALNSASSVINRVNTYTQNAIDQTLSVAENTMNTISEITETAIDAVNQTTQAVESLSATVAHTSSAILGDTDTASDIKDATEVIMEWTDGEFEEISSTATDAINQASQSITDAKNQAMNAVNDSLTTATDAISDAQKWLENLISDLKSKMDDLSAKIDGGFKDVTGLNSVSKGASYVTDALKESDNDSSAAQLTSAVTTSISEVLNNFSISKVITAFAGVLTQAGIVKLGLDQLPPIDFESMLYEIRNDLTKTNKDLYNELSLMVEDIDDFNDSLQKADERDYTDENYKNYVKKFSDDIKKQRDDIRLSMQYKGNLTKEQEAAKTMNEKLAAKSAIKEIKKFKKKVKGAKQAEKYTTLIGEELKNLKKEAEYCCNSIKSDWESMMKQYKDAIKEIKQFFQNGGDGDMFIDDCCDAINKDCDDIKELCSNIGTQLIGCTLKVAMPADIGLVVPNPVYKLASFWMDVKTIFKFIKDLITLIIDILNHINKLARIMLNGINNLSEIISQLMELLGLKWFMDLVQSIIDTFGSKITDAKLLLENSISPVYYKDTDEYQEILDYLEKLSETGTTKQIYTNSSDEIYNTLTSKKYYSISEINDTYYNLNNNSINTGSYTLDLDKCLTKLESMEDDLVAYRSPVLTYSGVKSSVSELTEGTGTLSFNISFKGWIYYHPNLDYTGSNYYTGTDFISVIFRKIKNKIIQKAARTSNKTNGGVLGLKNRWVVKNSKSGKNDTAFNAFYWYTYYTEDIEKDCFNSNASQNSEYIDNVVVTENGSIVRVKDGDKEMNVFVANNKVRSGDYVTVNGKKYRVQ